MHKPLLAAATLTLFLILSIAHAESSYKDEIMEHVIKPCHTMIIKGKGYDQVLGMDKALSIMREINAKEIEKEINQLTSTIKGKSFDERKWYYKINANTSCVINAKLIPDSIAQALPADITDPAEIMNSDISGIWSFGNGDGFMYLYPNKKMMMLGSNCDLKGHGNWKYEHRNLKIYQNGQQVAFITVIKLPRNLNPGGKMILDTGRDWMFLGKDTDMDC